MGITGAIEFLRREKTIGSSLEARLELAPYAETTTELLRTLDVAEIAITSTVTIETHEMSHSADKESSALNRQGNRYFHDGDEKIQIWVSKSDNQKCGRCWRHLPEVKEDGDLCGRCDEVVNG